MGNVLCFLSGFGALNICIYFPVSVKSFWWEVTSVVGWFLRLANGIQQMYCGLKEKRTPPVFTHLSPQ